jgi:hypothetical protein
LQLTEIERKMAEGEFGRAKQQCMRIQIQLAEAYDVEEFVPITAAHIDCNSYGRVSGEAKLSFARKMVEAGGKVSVPTTLNPGGRDIERWREFKLPEEFAEKCAEMERAYMKLGAIPTWTCAPYNTGTIPCKGENVAYAESNAIVFANSVLGARTPRYGDFFEVCSAITGRAPRFDLHLDQNRLADIHISVSDPAPFSFSDDQFYALLGYEVGRLSGGKVPVITGIPSGVSRDHLKTMGAAVASSGGVGLFHIVGVTPEAPTLEAVLPEGEQPVEKVVTGKELTRAKGELTVEEDRELDLVLLGCPHFSLPEFQKLSDLLGGREVAEGVEFWVQTNREVYSWIEEMGILARLRNRGVRVSTDSCIFNWPLDNWSFETAVTNSAKFSHYAPNDLGFATSLLDLEGCVDAGCRGELEPGGEL